MNEFETWSASLRSRYLLKIKTRSILIIESWSVKFCFLYFSWEKKVCCYNRRKVFDKLCSHTREMKDENTKKKVFNWLIWYHVVGGVNFYWLKNRTQEREREREGARRVDLIGLKMVIIDWLISTICFNEEETKNILLIW